MICKKLFSKSVKAVFTLVIMVVCLSVKAQQTLIVNMAMLDGVGITPDNVFNFQVQSLSAKPIEAMVRGTIRYRNSPMSITYSFKCIFSQGTTMMQGNGRGAVWQYSSSALQDLFQRYKILPTGTYEYCVSVGLIHTSDFAATGSDECIYHKSDDLFLINLIDPENNAKIHEYNPQLSWVANFPFASELTYRIRVATIQQGQNAINAVTRNNAVYSESNLSQNSVVYPVFAKPLVANQPYAWMVDAYYKSVLLGSSEAWQFKIIEDSLYTGPLGGTSYVDIKREHGKTQLYALGQLKLKYDLEETRVDTLTLSLTDNNGNVIDLKNKKLPAKYGDNRYDLVFKDNYVMKHTGSYLLTIITQKSGSFTLPFEYINPDLIK